MINQIADMDEFKIDKLTNDILQKFHDFLEKEDYIKFFIWLDVKNENSVEHSFDSAPKFFGSDIVAE